MQEEHKFYSQQKQRKILWGEILAEASRPWKALMMFSDAMPHLGASWLAMST